MSYVDEVIESVVAKTQLSRNSIRQSKRFWNLFALLLKQTRKNREKSLFWERMVERKGGSDFDPKGKSDREDHGILPELYDRALQIYRRRHRRTGW